MIRRVIAMLACAAAAVTAADQSRGREYRVYVASEAADKISVLQFDGASFRIEQQFDTGVMPVDIDGPHGVALDPAGASLFVSIAHGQPNGALWKYSTTTNKPVGRVTLGMFPATLQVSPSGEFVYVVNFNLHGNPVPSSVSIVHAESMTELARVTTCRMPHGSRFNPQGTRHYSACMMDDRVVEIDTATLRVSREFQLSPVVATGDHAAGHDANPSTPATPACAPTWVQPSSDGSSLFVACNGSNEIVELGVDTGPVRRRIGVRNGVYNLATTHDGRLLVATNRRDQSASILEAVSGRERARIATPRRAVHGVAISGDDRFAFVSSEGVGAESGSVIAIDLASMTIVATAEVPPQAGGIDVH
jgi:DNA-binding beta-propeller fold protein YncE